MTMPVKPKTETLLARHMIQAGQWSAWAETAAQIYSRGVARIFSACGVDPNEFLLKRLKFEEAPDEGDFEVSPFIFAQPAYHGSPHRDIEKFSLDNIGTGEGQQTYGWGLYFADEKEVAEYYRSVLAPRHKADITFPGGDTISTNDPEFLDRLDGVLADLDIFERYQIDIPALFLLHNAFNYSALDAAEKRFSELSEKNERDGLPEEANRYTRIGNALRELRRRGLKEAPNLGQLYKVNIPEDSDLLDYDQPFAKQPPQVKAALQKLFRDNKNPSPERGGITHLHLNKTFTGSRLYRRIELVLGSPEKASRLLNKYGVKGIRYLDAFSRGYDKDSHNYVIFDDHAIEVLATYYQGTAGKPRGWTEFLDDGSFRVIFGPRADASTAIHEAAHLFRELMRRAVDSPPEKIVDLAAFRQLREDWQTVENWLSKLDDDVALKNEYDRWGLSGHFSGLDFDTLNPEEKSQARDIAKHEHFARGFETYLMEGRAPTTGLRGVFRRMKDWLLDIYSDHQELEAPLTPEVREVFDRLLASDQELRAEKIRDDNMNETIYPVKGSRKHARRAKIDPNQYSFDFELAAALADQLEAERNEEDSQNDERPALTLVHSGPGLETGNPGGDQPQPVLQPIRLQNTGQVGHELAGETESPGKLRPDSPDDTNPGTAKSGTEHSGEPGGFRAVAERPDGTRDSGGAGSEHRTVTAADYVISEADRLGEGGAKVKFRDNLEALKVLKRLLADEAPFASPEDQQTLVKYVGWGGLPQAFDLNNAEWKNEAAELLELLTAPEYGQARRSTQDAHYTSQEVIQGIYQGLERLGFQGPANILEPSAGVGHFLGLMPEALRAETQITAVELDPLTSDIGRYLYPQAVHLKQGFQTVNIPDGHFDLAIGNPPFGSQKVYDRARPYLDYSIHNYFLAKSIESLREGGLAAFVVSRYFLDAEHNPARDFIASQANLLGAVRLPNTAFKKNALTEVTTDILFFQKTSQPEIAPAWLRTASIEDAEGNPIRLNRYYMERPEQMIGRMAMTHNMFREAAGLLPPEDFAGFTPEIAKRLEILPQNLYQPRSGLDFQTLSANDPNLEKCSGLKADAFFMSADGRLARRRADLMGQLPYELYEPKNQRAGERIAGMIQIRDSLTGLMKAEQLVGASETFLDSRRARLNRLYDDFVKKYGYINSLANRQAFRDDPEYPLLSSLERDYDAGLSAEAAQKANREPKAPSASKADILRRRVLGPRLQITHVDTPKEALVVAMNEKGRPDLEFMESLCGRSSEEMAADLAGLIYQNPVNEAWELADHYLTGNVKAKLADAQKAAELDGRFKSNVEALLAVQPPDLDPVDISVQLGSTWVPPEVVADFARHLFGPLSVGDLGYHPALASWVVDFNRPHIDRTLATNVWGTDSYSGPRLVESILNNTPIKVMDEVGRDERDKPIMKQNDAETAAANQKAEEIKQAFLDWIWNDQTRREELARLYNDRFNTHVPRKYDGSHLELPGTSLNIKLRPHQKDAIWRGIQDQGALYDMVVGSGKTYTIVATIMESRRMGLSRKAMVVVPNHLLTQWQDAFYSLYPQAKILTTGKDDFKKANREKLFAKVATGDWDAVIVAHSSFKKIGLPPATLNKVLTEQIDDLSEAIAEIKRENGQRTLVKEMEKTRERLKAMMERRAGNEEKDRVVTFADLGIDQLHIDEVQEYKNLIINTRLRNVSGLGNLSGSDKAFDLFVKCRYLQEENNGRGVFFATGTPISNTIAEMYTLQRYLQYPELKAKGLAHFDAWASTFGEVVTGWELDATGVGYRLNSRFSRFQNMPELAGMYRTVAEVVTQSDLDARNPGPSLTPRVKGGKPLNLVVERSPLQAGYMGVQRPVLNEKGLPLLRPDGSQVMEWPKGSIIHRMENLPKDPSVDNPLKITNDARKAGLDYRLIDPSAPDFEGSKINAAADNIVRIWKEWEADRGAQLVFCDLSTPKMARTALKSDVQHEAVLKDDGPEDDIPSLSMDELLGQSSRFSVYDDLKKKLIGRGIPGEEIRFIHEANTDAQKAKLFDEVNRGEVRVLMGSTAKMGAGTNVQKRLVALHHLDAPWRPADLTQREGRIIRQGNELHARDPEGFEVEIIRYATRQTYDSRSWQTIQGKAEGIEQFRKGDSLARVIEDVAGEAANAAEMKAAATGNELIFTQVKLAAELKKLEAIYAAHQRSRHRLESRVAWLEKAPERAAQEIGGWKKGIELRDKNTAKEAYFAAGGRIYGEKNRKELLFEIARVMKEAGIRPGQFQSAGSYRGFAVRVVARGQGRQFMLESESARYEPPTLNYQPNSEFSINGFFQRMDNFLGKFERNIEDAEKELERQKAALLIAKEGRGQDFPQMALLEVLRQDNREVMRELQIMQKDPAYKSEWKPQSMGMGDKEAKEAKEADTRICYGRL